jgi:DNA invertase Pin-like site-specific DNA recombinase
MKLGYIRVSTHEQRPDRQIAGLEALCDELHVEKLSAVSASRPVFDALIARLEPGDTLVIWDLDRAFRSTVDALVEAEGLRARGVGFQIVSLQVDTATPAGMLAYTVMAAFAEFERRMISKRTKEGLAAARSRGKRLGRPPKLTKAQLRDARKRLRDEQVTITSIAKELEVAPWTLSRALARRGTKGSAKSLVDVEDSDSLRPD